MNFTVPACFILSAILALCPAIYSEELSGANDVPELLQVGNSRIEFLDDYDMRIAYYTRLGHWEFRELQNDILAYVIAHNSDVGADAFAALPLLHEAAAYIDKYEVQVDEFDGTKTLYYKGLETLSKNNCVAISIDTTQSYDIRVDIGLVGDSWLRFDDMRISQDGKIIYSHKYKSSEVSREKFGRTYVEWVTLKISNSHEADSLFDNESPLIDSKVTIRFTKSSTGKCIDRKLTDAEKQALDEAVKLADVIRRLYRLAENYDQRDASRRKIDQVVKEANNEGCPLLPSDIDTNGLILDTALPKYIYIDRYSRSSTEDQIKRKEEYWKGNKYLIKASIYEQNVHNGYFFIEHLRHVMLVLLPEQLSTEDATLLKRDQTAYFYLTFIGVRNDGCLVFYLGRIEEDDMQQVIFPSNNPTRQGYYTY